MNIPELQEYIPLAPLTTFKIGGSARFFVIVRTKEEMLHALNEARKEQIPWYILGGGSNVLVATSGFPGLIIKSEIRTVEIDEEHAQARLGSGLLMSGAIAKTAKAGLAGLEYAIGVPATIGGAIWANLGARGSQLQDFLLETSVIDEQGNQGTLSREDCQYGYRDSIFKQKRYAIIDGLFQLHKEDSRQIRQRIQELSQLRTSTQDITAQCAGCVFRNPKDQTEIAAAKLIDDLGLKGFQIGGAQVSEKHANFIVNTGNATAEDVIMLISLIKQKVRDNKGVQLMEEIEYVGF